MKQCYKIQKKVNSKAQCTICSVKIEQIEKGAMKEEEETNRREVKCRGKWKQTKRGRVRCEAFYRQMITPRQVGKWREGNKKSMHLCLSLPSEEIYVNTLR